MRSALNALSWLRQVWMARVKATGEDVAVKLLDLENLNCSLVSHAQDWQSQLVSAVVNPPVHAGRDYQRGTDNAAAAPSQCSAPALLFCAPAELVDGDALCCWRLGAQLDEVCVFRGVI